MVRRYLLAASLVIGLLAATPAPAAASSDAPMTAATTYTLVPSKGVIQVAVDVRVTNQIPSTTNYVACTQYMWDPYIGLIPYASTCPHTTNYYLDTTQIWTEDSAKNLAVKADSGSVTKTVEKHQAGYTLWTLHFSRILNGHARKLHVTYTIPGGKPRSSTFARAGAAYARFCATGNGFDGGSVRVVIPAAFDTQTAGGDATRTISGSNAVYNSGSVTDPIAFYLCVVGTNAAAYRKATVTAPDGRTVVVESWPEDGQWQSAVETDAGSSLAALESLIGQPIPEQGQLTVREVAASAMGDYAGFFDPATMTMDVSEDLQTGTVAHELAHAWFNGNTFADRWLDEGSAEWAERSVSQTGSCGDPGAYPGTGSPDLTAWTFLGPKATDAERAVVQFQYGAACYLVSTEQHGLTTAQLNAAYAYLLARKVPYLADQPDRLPAGPISWKTWLDVMDEVGRGRDGAGSSGGGTAQAVLVRYGIATDDAATLAARSTARQAYYAYVAGQPDWQLPLYIRREMAEWKFASASAGIGLASDLVTAATAADQALPEAASQVSTQESALARAATDGDLRTAISTAKAMTAAATHVAASLAASRQPLDFFGQVGLLGTELEPTRAAAVTAVRAGDAIGAEALASQLASTVAMLPDVGRGRVVAAVAATVTLLLILLVVTLLMRRRRRRALALAASTALAAPVQLLEATGQPLVGTGEPRVDETVVVPDDPGGGAPPPDRGV